MRQQGLGTTGSRFRQRKLNVKAHLPVIREHDFNGDGQDEGSDRHDASLTSLPKVESGVESKEEKEHHLQAALSASHAAAVGGKIDQIYIPTPDAVRSDAHYETLYPPRFAQPTTYIRFSSTVEDSIGCPYCMTDEDEEVLKTINKKKSPGNQCSEDQFEIVMNFFEEKSQLDQPFAAVDNTPVLSFEEMEAAFDDTIDEQARAFTKEIYAHWRRLRTEKGNRSLIAKIKTLKMDSGQEADDSDPYICFRRREVRQVRKTRGRDAQIIEKLKKLRRELEEGRQLLHWVKQREETRKEDLRLGRQIFEQRSAVREMKRTLNIQDDFDELLVTVRPKRKSAEPLQPTRQAQQPRLDRAPSIPELDMVFFKDKLAAREDTIATQIEKSLRKFDLWNTKFVDRTKDFLLGLFSPSKDGQANSDFVSVKADTEAVQEPTPPPSVDGENTGDDGGADSEMSDRDDTIVQLETPSDSSSSGSNRFLYRQRRGRGGLMLDRRALRGRRQQQQQQQHMVDAKTREQWKYDRESGDEDEDDAPPVDLGGAAAFRYRQHLRGWDAQFRQNAANHARAHASTEAPPRPPPAPAESRA